MVYEATGYDVSLHHQPLLAGLSLPHCDGLPLLDAHLQAQPGLHLVGPLAELELGPAGRNLWGARHAARRITNIAADGTPTSTTTASPPPS